MNILKMKWNEELGYSAYKISLKYIYIYIILRKFYFEKWLFISFLILNSHLSTMWKFIMGKFIQECSFMNKD